MPASCVVRFPEVTIGTLPEDILGTIRVNGDRGRRAQLASMRQRDWAVPDAAGVPRFPQVAGRWIAPVDVVFAVRPGRCGQVRAVASGGASREILEVDVLEVASRPSPFAVGTVVAIDAVAVRVDTVVVLDGNACT